MNYSFTKSKLAMDNIAKLTGNNLTCKILRVYSDHDSYYAVTEKNTSYAGKRDFYIVTYCISCPKPYEICKADVEFTDISNKIELVNIDTVGSKRSGHGSIALSALKKIAQNSGAEYIWGDLYLKTPIGLENLKRFYVKNGFEIRNNKCYFYFDKVL